MQISLPRNVILLILAQACYLAVSMTVATFAGLAGNLIAENKTLATLPVSLTILSTALSTAPMSMLMQRRSRRFGFRLGACIGIGAALMGAYSIYSGHFVLLCLSALMFGPFNAGAQYYRFAAAESVPQAAAPRAMSLVLVGGLLAAVLVPGLSSYFNTAFMPYSFMGAYLFVALAAATLLLPLAFLRPVEHRDGGNLATDEVARTLREVARQPAFFVAVLNGALGFAMMSFVMTATPLAMAMCGLDAGASASVIQWHVVAMFLPSLFTGQLIARFGVLPVLLAGHGAFLLAFLIALSGIGEQHFLLALIALGLGWNFCFVGGSTLLTSLHRDSERGKVQGLNELLVFGTTAVASLAAGVILRYYGWQMVNQAAFVMLAIAMVITVIWGLGRLRRRAA